MEDNKKEYVIIVILAIAVLVLSVALGYCQNVNQGIQCPEPYIAQPIPDDNDYQPVPMTEDPVVPKTAGEIAGDAYNEAKDGVVDFWSDFNKQTGASNFFSEKYNNAKDAIKGALNDYGEETQNNKEDYSQNL